MSALRDLALADGRRVPANLLDLRFARAGGPGGQHVNKTETKVDLRLDLASAVDVLGEADVARIRTRLANRIAADDTLRVVCDATRSRHRNVELAVERMEALLREALARRKKRRATRPTRASQERRLAEKKRRSDIKRWRRES